MARTPTPTTRPQSQWTSEYLQKWVGALPPQRLVGGQQGQIQFDPTKARRQTATGVPGGFEASASGLSNVPLPTAQVTPGIRQDVQPGSFEDFMGMTNLPGTSGAGAQTQPAGGGTFPSGDISSFWPMQMPGAGAPTTEPSPSGDTRAIWGEGFGEQAPKTEWVEFRDRGGGDSRILMQIHPSTGEYRPVLGDDKRPLVEWGPRPEVEQEEKPPEQFRLREGQSDSIIVFNKATGQNEIRYYNEWTGKYDIEGGIAPQQTPPQSTIPQNVWNPTMPEDWAAIGASAASGRGMGNVDAPTRETMTWLQGQGWADEDIWAAYFDWRLDPGRYTSLQDAISKQPEKFLTQEQVEMRQQISGGFQTWPTGTGPAGPRSAGGGRRVVQAGAGPQSGFQQFE